MVTKEKIINYIISNKQTLKKEFHIDKIGLFGSFARGDEDKSSDIDLIVEFDKDINDIFEIKLRLTEVLKKHFKRDIDIAREKYLKPRVKDTILKETIYVE